MQAYSSPVLTAVAYPPTVLYVPPKAGVGNLVVNVVLFLMTNVLTDWPPYIWGLTLVIGHAVLAMLAMKEPHMVPMSEAKMQRSKWAKQSMLGRTHNIIKAAGRKYVP